MKSYTLPRCGAAIVLWWILLSGSGCAGKGTATGSGSDQPQPSDSTGTVAISAALTAIRLAIEVPENLPPEGDRLLVLGPDGVHDFAIGEDAAGLLFDFRDLESEPLDATVADDARAHAPAVLLVERHFVALELAAELAIRPRAGIDLGGLLGQLKVGHLFS